MSDGPEPPGPPIQAVMIPLTPFQQDSPRLWYTETMRGTVTDPGGDLELIDSAIAKRAVTVEKILITDCHPYHAGGTKDPARRLAVPVEGQCRMSGFAGAMEFEPDRRRKDGDTVSVGNVTMDVIHRPGHTPGHVVFVHRGDEFAMVGDVLFQGSIGRSEFPTGNHDELVASIRNKLFPLGDDTAFITGHGPPCTSGQERWTNPFFCDMALGWPDRFVRRRPAGLWKCHEMSACVRRTGMSRNGDRGLVAMRVAWGEDSDSGRRCAERVGTGWRSCSCRKGGLGA